MVSQRILNWTHDNFTFVLYTLCYSYDLPIMQCFRADEVKKRHQSTILYFKKIFYIHGPAI